MSYQELILFLSFYFLQIKFKELRWQITFFAAAGFLHHIEKQLNM